MELLLIILILLLVGIILFLLFRKSSIDPSLLEWMKSMQQSVHTTERTMYTTLQENSRQLNERLDKAAQAMRDVNKEVGRMSEIGKNMQELQEFLSSPKLRGNIGEQVLTDLIKQIFPQRSFHLQYAFKNGEKVDAAIQTDAGILPIDSKFPMENFQKYAKAETEEEKQLHKKEFTKDIHRHIDAIAKKYIVPSEGTMDFALMYIPSETVFYEVINSDDILEYARGKRVYIVSPTTLYAHLQTILLSFEGKKIESRSKEIFALLRSLQNDYTKVNDSLDVLGKHLINASNQFSNVSKGFNQIGNKLSTTHQLEVSEKELLS